MRSNQAFVLSLFASVTFMSGAALAGDTVYLTPPLFRDQARETQHARSISDLTTTPQPIAAANPVVAPLAVHVDGDVKTTGSF